MSVKLYSTAVQQHSSTARHAVGHPAGLAPAAAFSTCSHSQATGCRESLLQDISSHNATKPYKVALLLPAHTFTPDPHQSHSPAAASSPSIDKQAGMQDSSSGVSDSATEDATTSADESSTADAMQPTLPSAAQHSSVQGLLLTVHVEQEVAGQINLAKATQYIPAGEANISTSSQRVTNTVCSHYQRLLVQSSMLAAQSLAHLTQQQLVLTAPHASSTSPHLIPT